MESKRFIVITIKTDPDTAADLEELRQGYPLPKSISQMGHILLRRGIKDTKRIKAEAMEIGYTSTR